MTALVLIDHEAGLIKQASRSAVTAAAQLGEVHVLVAGLGIDAVAAAAAGIAGVSRVLKADAALYDKPLAEPLAALLDGFNPVRPEPPHGSYGNVPASFDQKSKDPGRDEATWAPRRVKES